MTRLSFLGAVSIVALGILVLLFLDDRTTRTAPTTAECIALWNGPANTTSQAEVAERRYPAAEIGGAFSEDRYQGCFALFHRRGRAVGPLLRDADPGIRAAAPMAARRR